MKNTENLKNDFNLCPMCGSKKIVNQGNRKWICDDCGFELYCNVAAAVGIVIYDKDYNVLFEIRAKEPKKGKACLPGGFVDFDESAEAAIKRELCEELGIRIETFEYLCSYPNIYEYKNLEYRTCDIFFAARIADEYDGMNEYIKHLRPEKGEVSDLAVFRVKTKEDIEKIPLAFESANKTLLKFVECNKRRQF